MGLLAFGIGVGGASAASPLQDRFGRDLEPLGITLVDWEGYMANPAIGFSILPPPNAALPITVKVTGTEPRLAFDLPSRAGKGGPEKTLQIESPGPVSMTVTIFPAREKRKLETTLAVELTDARGLKHLLILPVHVIVSANQPAPSTYPITVDFSQDKTGFFKDAVHQATVRQAAQDWSFYLESIPLLSVGPGEEKTFIWEPTGFSKNDLVTNPRGYTGYLLYAYGITGPELRSGGEPSSAGEFQVSRGQTLSIRRSGGLEVETDGNYNKLGWLPPLRDDEWWRAANLGNIQNDLYSIVHHEMGHALFFNPTNPKFPRNGSLNDPAIRAYLGSGVKTDRTDHFAGFVDPASQLGAFGNEYHSRMPLGRWLITKLDLLCAEAVGYKLRKVDALTPPAILTLHLVDAVVGKPYQTTLGAEGGIPFYDWAVSAGNLPAGLKLDRFSGAISGTPAAAGAKSFTVQLRDYTPDTPGVKRDLVLTVHEH